MSVRAAELFFETLVLRPRVPAATLAGAWRGVRPGALAVLAEFEGSAQWMWRRLREIGASDAAPAPFARAVAERARRDAARNLLVEAEAERVIRRLNELGVPVVLIKGIARRVLPARWPYGDARATNDVDVLVRAGDAERVWQDFVARGYHRYNEFEAPPHELPPIVGAGRVSVDIHVSLSRALPASEAWRRATTGSLELEWRGLQVRVPCAGELLWHGLTHALRHEVGAWRLRFFLDGAAILASGDPVEWDSLRSRLDAAEVDPAVARRWLDAAAQLAGVELPEGVSPVGPRFDARRMLRWRLAVLARGGDAGFTGRLLEEGTRVETGSPATPQVQGAPPWKRARRLVAGRVARSVYRIWRAAVSSGLPAGAAQELAERHAA